MLYAQSGCFLMSAFIEIPLSALEVAVFYLPDAGMLIYTERIP
jgi:hypothetical protein